MKKGQKRIKTSHGLTRNLTEGRIDGRIRVSICHGRTRNFTEKTEAETRKKIDAAAEAFATEFHGKNRSRDTEKD